MLQLEVLILELFPIDRLPAAVISGCEVITLTHKSRDHTIEDGPFEVERLPTAPFAFLAGEQRLEVLRREGKKGDGR